MTCLVCPHCGERIEVFHRGRVSRVADDGTVPRLAQNPLDPQISAAVDTGRSVVIAVPGSAQSLAFVALAAAVAARLGIMPGSADDPS